MKKRILFLILLFCSLYSNAQFSDNFNDGDFTTNPVWSGTSSSWLVNSSFQLQSNNTTASSRFYLSTASTLATTAQWEFYCRLAFNTSGANYADVFIISSKSNVTDPLTTGYFVRMGSTADEISLYRRDAGGVNVKIIDGGNGILKKANNTLKIKIIRDAGNQWNLLRDISGVGTNYISEGVVTDAAYLSSSFFSLYIKQSTASFFKKHYFDDFVVKPYAPDITPPAIQSVSVISANMLDVLFNEPVDVTSAETTINYFVNNGIGSPSMATVDAANDSLVHLGFASNFPNRTNLLLTINGVKDLAGNAISNGSAAFTYFKAFQYDIVIDEIMADPSPQVGLPDIEWIELKNTTGFNINLLGWRVGKVGSPSGPMPSYILKPDSFVIVCTGSAVPAMSAFGPAISVTSFPSLNNTGDVIYLQSPQGNTIHAVNYSDAWYQNELKKKGGWSLEMIDTRNPCSGFTNWKASIDIKGGTPSKKNATNAVNADAIAPKLLSAYATDSVNIILVFDEPLDSLKSTAIANYAISDGIGSPAIATAVSPLFNRVNLRLAAPLMRNKIYTITVSNIRDCVNNSIGFKNTARVGLYEPLDNFNIVINEILFNPKSNGTDYVELYNRSNKIFNLKSVYIANRNTTGTISSITQLSTEDHLFFPQEFIVVTKDAEAVKRNYVSQNPDAFIEIATMPSYNDDKGNVIILNEQGNIVDEVAYSEKWHFKLISNNEGVSLERVDYNAPSQNADNWHSAATNIGYGTPTYKNSQIRTDGGVKGEITISPEIVSPDNDGIDDFATIDYSFPEPGYVTNITIFDAVGRPVRYLQRNALSGTKGYYRWDGLGEKNQKLPVGIYIIYTEVFNLQGKTKKFKHTIVLARRQ